MTVRAHLPKQERSCIAATFLSGETPSIDAGILFLFTKSLPFSKIGSVILEGLNSLYVVLFKLDGDIG